MLIRKITKSRPKEVREKRASRWKSEAHRNHVHSHACVNCGSEAPIECAHIRIDSGAGLSQKPDDWRTVSLCKDYHTRQHNIGERTFWDNFKAQHGYGYERLIDQFISTSPKRREIDEAMKVRDGRA